MFTHLAYNFDGVNSLDFALRFPSTFRSKFFDSLIKIFLLPTLAEMKYLIFDFSNNFIRKFIRNDKNKISFTKFKFIFWIFFFSNGPEHMILTQMRSKVGTGRSPTRRPVNFDFGFSFNVLVIIYVKTLIFSTALVICYILRPFRHLRLSPAPHPEPELNRSLF